MVRQANEDTRYTYARVVRLLKHWNRGNGTPCAPGTSRPSRSPCITDARPSCSTGWSTWFDHAIDELSEGLTEDPADVAEKPISLNKM